MEIQTAVHKIYQQLSVTLERALQANKHHIGTDSKHPPGSLDSLQSRFFCFLMVKLMTTFIILIRY